jgi:signal transduction histidine kinase
VITGRTVFRSGVGPGTGVRSPVGAPRGGDNPTRTVQGAVSRLGPGSPTVGSVTVTSTAPPPGAGFRIELRGASSGLPVLVRTWLWGWLALAQFITGILLSGFYLGFVFTMLVVGLAMIPVLGIGVPITAIVLAFAHVLGAFERARIAAFSGTRIGPASPPPAGQPAWRRLLFDARPWRASGYLMIISLWNILAGAFTLSLLSVSAALAALPLYRAELPGGRLTLVDPVTVPASGWFALLGWAGLLLVPIVARGLVFADVHLARWLLGPNPHEQVAALSERVETLTLTREAAVDSVELERRRIERDLHDGPQQRLVAIAMDLGMARERLHRDPDGAGELLDQAHTAAKEAIVEMRQVARGIHPPVLTDRGLDAALSALATRSPVPVSVRVDVDARPSATVEAIAYFCVSEALTNVAKHSGAHTATVEVLGRAGRLTVIVTDDGHGGAAFGRGTGLVGLRDRVAAVDGTLTVSSPMGGPTALTVSLPAPPRPSTSGSSR